MNGGKNKWLIVGGGTEAFTLLVLYFFGFLFGAFAISAFLGGEGLNSVYNIRGANIIQAIFVFLIPTVIYSILFADSKIKFYIERPLIFKILGLAIAVIFCVQPFVEMVNYYCNLIPFPESIQESITQMTERYIKMYDLLFGQKTTVDLLLNLLIVAVVPGILEELFFRGCLQRSILRAVKNPHIGVWITAIIFSAIHLQIAGFFPRILLGALLGYLYLWTKNIWVPILVHIVNNAMVVIILQLLADKEFYKNMQLADYSLGNAWYIALISLGLTIGLLYLIYRVRPKEELPQQTE